MRKATSGLQLRGVHRFAFVLVLLLIVLSAVVHGGLSGRWTSHDDVESVGQAIENFPENCGDWQFISSQDIGEASKRILQCYGSKAAYYQHTLSGEQVGVFLIYGPRGPTAVHRPEVCYSSTGKVSLGEREQVSLDGSKDQFWITKFRNREEPIASLEVWYGFSDGGNWQAAERPRFWMTDRLFKIQASGPSPKNIGDPSLVADFMKHFVPSIRPNLTN